VTTDTTENPSENTNTADDQSKLEGGAGEPEQPYTPATFDFNTEDEANAVAKAVKGSVEKRGVSYHVNLPDA
jgi:hypothetical protein